MRNKPERGARESRLASGWTVEAGPGDVDAALDAAEARAAVGGGSGRGLLGGSGTDAGNGAGNDAENSAASAAVEAGAGAGSLDSQAKAQLSAGMLVLFGVIGGLYLLYTIVWLSWAKYYSDANAAIAEASGVVGSVFQQVLFWLAPFAPVLWFLSVLLRLRGARTRTLLIWLLVGAVVLVPLPMFEMGAAS